MHSQPRQNEAPRATRTRGAATRVLSRLLCLLVLPLAVMVGTTGVAEAASKVSGTTDPLVYRPADSFVPGHWIECTAVVFYRVSGNTGGPYTQTINVTGDCDSGWNLDSAGDSVSWGFNGETVDGTQPCNVFGVAGVIDDSGDEKYSVSGQWGVGPMADPGDLCAVTEACVTQVKEGSWGPDDAYSYQECWAVGMGDPALPGGSGTTCSAWTPLGVEEVIVDLGGGQTRREFRVQFSGPVTSSHDPILYTDWEGTFDSRGTETFEAWEHLGGGLYKIPYSSGRWSTRGMTGFGSTDPGAVLRGVEIMVRTTDTTWWATTGPAGRSSGNAQLEYVAVGDSDPKTDPAGVVWRTNPTYCYFWFGPKMYDDPANIFDEPWASLTDPHDDGDDPDPAPGTPGGRDDPCTFQLSDPSTWLEGGMCAAVGLLGGILGVLREVVVAIVDLGASIAAALAGLLSEAFIPDPSSWDVDEVKQQVEEKPPFSVGAELTDGVTAAAVSYTSASGCQNPMSGFTDETLVGCGGFEDGGVFGALRALMTLALFITTGVALWSMFGAAFRNT